MSIKHLDDDLDFDDDGGMAVVGILLGMGWGMICGAVLALVLS